MAPDDAQAYVPPETAPAQRGRPLRRRPENGRRGWFVLGGLVILALLVGVVVAGGRLRNGLGVALTLVAVVFVVALVVTALTPAALARWFPGLTPRQLLVASARWRRAASSSPPSYVDRLESSRPRTAIALDDTPRS